MKRFLTGLQPSGKLHLGNYFGVMKKVLEYQYNYDFYLFIANLHSITTFQDKNTLLENTYSAVCDFLALGLEPKRCTFWIQSDVPEVTEITWYLSMAITHDHLIRAHSYKDKVEKGIHPSVGLFIYPVLMAADILTFDTDVVPVGKDQKQHLEFARDIAETFNRKFGEVFKIPEPEIDEDTAVVLGIDGQKMSKSYNNTINLFDDEKKIKKAVMSIVTDSAGVNDIKDPDSSIIFSIYSLFLDESERRTLRERFLKPGLGYGDLKKELFQKIMDYFAPYREKRNEYLNNLDYVEKILQEGSRKAKELAQTKLKQIRNILGLERQ